MPVIRSVRTGNEIIRWSVAGLPPNLGGLDLSDAELYGYHITADLTGARRNADDAPIRGWRRNADTGTLERACLTADCPCEDEIDAMCCYCNDHCPHSICATCNRHRNTCCPECDCCGNCCECMHCRDCGDAISPSSATSRHYCNECDLCTECCGCTMAPRNPGAPWRAQRNSKFPCKRLVGVEWEYNYNVDLVDWANKWRAGIHTDGSCGWEAVTAPMAGDYIRECLIELAKELKDKNAGTNESCGIHVHVDAKDLRWADMLRLLRVYARVEPILYLLAGQNRVRNTYCKPCGDDYLYAANSDNPRNGVIAVAAQLSASNTPEAKRYIRETMRGAVKKHGGRYRGLNIWPWLAGRKNKAPDTTVEFRIHKNSDDGERVTMWAQLCALLVDYAAKASDADVAALPGSGLRTLVQIAPGHKDWILERIGEWRSVSKLGGTAPRYIKFGGHGVSINTGARPRKLTRPTPQAPRPRRCYSWGDLPPWLALYPEDFSIHGDALAANGRAQFRLTAPVYHMAHEYHWALTAPDCAAETAARDADWEIRLQTIRPLPPSFSPECPCTSCRLELRTRRDLVIAAGRTTPAAPPSYAERVRAAASTVFTARS